jgi:L-ascorbate metabolism protein UlaG (beta-lactamase superfamily)
LPKGGIYYFDDCGRNRGDIRISRHDGCKARVRLISKPRVRAGFVFSGAGLVWQPSVSIEFPERLVYFADDTAFGSHSAQIREEFGSPQLALLPIGAYEPRWFISPLHMAPEEAVGAHEILGAKTSIAIHHGTFQLADDGIDTPEKQLVACRRDDSLLILKNGQFANIT